jgi:hypothetical protein
VEIDLSNVLNSASSEELSSLDEDAKAAYMEMVRQKRLARVSEREQEALANQQRLRDERMKNSSIDHSDISARSFWLTKDKKKIQADEEAAAAQARAEEEARLDELLRKDEIEAAKAAKAAKELAKKQEVERILEQKEAEMKKVSQIREEVDREERQFQQRRKSMLTSGSSPRANSTDSSAPPAFPRTASTDSTAAAEMLGSQQNSPRNSIASSIGSGRVVSTDGAEQLGSASNGTSALMKELACEAQPGAGKSSPVESGQNTGTSSESAAAPAAGKTEEAASAAPANAPAAAAAAAVVVSPEDRPRQVTVEKFSRTVSFNAGTDVFPTAGADSAKSSPIKLASPSRSGSFVMPTTAPLIVTPTPGFVMKSKKISDGEKVFVNVCHHPSVPATDETAASASSSGKASKSILIAIGDIRETTDKSGESSLLVDVAINTIKYEDCVKDAASNSLDKVSLTIEILWYFVVNHVCVEQLCTRILKKVGNAIGDNLDDEYKTPKTNRNYKGADTVSNIDIGKYVSGGAGGSSAASASGWSPRATSGSSSTPTAGGAPIRRGSLNSVSGEDDIRLSGQSAVSAEEQKKWAPLLKSGERLIKTGSVGKKNNYGLTQTRQLLLTDYPRLLYADPSSFVVKGEVECAFGQVTGVATSSGSSAFEVKDSSGRVFKFSDNNKTAADWATVINAAFTKPRSGSA